MEGWQLLAAIGGPALGALGVIVAAWFGLRGRRRETQVAEAAQSDSAISSRFDDASELSKYIREQVVEEVDRQMKPIRAELDQARETVSAVRARETRLWLWDRTGRAGELPMLPADILHRLELGYLIPKDALDDTVPINRTE